jgi:hypothetical protein
MKSSAASAEAGIIYIKKEIRMIVDERLREDLKEIETRIDDIRGYL